MAKSVKVIPKPSADAAVKADFSSHARADANELAGDQGDIAPTALIDDADAGIFAQKPIPPPKITLEYTPGEDDGVHFLENRRLTPG